MGHQRVNLAVQFVHAGVLTVAFSILAGVLFLAVPAAVVAGVVALVRRRPGRGEVTGEGAATGVRRFFQYALLYVLTVTAAAGLTDLAGSVIDGDLEVGRLAYPLTFTVVGVPVAGLIAGWTRTLLARDVGEAESSLFAAYVTVSALTAAVVTMFAGQVVLSSPFTIGFDGSAFTAFPIWGGLWWAHWHLSARYLRPGRDWSHLLAGSLISLGTVVVAFAVLLGAIVDAFTLPFGAGGFVVDDGGSVAGPAAAFMVGAAMWVRYWVFGAARMERSTPWFAYVLLFGVAGGFLMSVSASSAFLWRVLTWVAGDPSGTARDHFSGASTMFAFTVAGAVTWWYHRAVLESVVGGSGPVRTEVRRVYEYLLAAVGLSAAAAGVGMVVVTAVEAFTPGLDVGMSTVDTLLAAVTLLVVGVPLWWTFWVRVRTAWTVDPAGEVSSPTRRTYLVALFGVAGVAAVVALVVAVFALLDDVLKLSASAETFRTMRYALGVLVAAVAVSAYHWAVFREDRDVAAATAAAVVAVAPSGPASVLLVGAPDAGVAGEVERVTGARTVLAVRSDDVAPPWVVGDVVSAVGRYPGEDVIVVGDGAGFHVVRARL